MTDDLFPLTQEGPPPPLDRPKSKFKRTLDAMKPGDTFLVPNEAGMKEGSIARQLYDQKQKTGYNYPRRTTSLGMRIWCLEKK